jgi:Putative peptidoglycan binding domain
MRRVVVTVVLLALLGGAAAVAAAQPGGAVGVNEEGPGGPADPGASEESEDPATTTATVEIATIEQRESFDGTLGYGERQELGLRIEGTLTALAEEGAVLDRGALVATADDVPVHLLLGGIPQWRAFSTAMTDGPDVRQLEENLLALGYGTASSSFPDNDFNWVTREAVEDWQAAQGVTEDGRIELGEVLVLPAPVRVAERLVALGAPTGQEPVLAVTGTERLVTLDVETGDAALFVPEAPATVELPDGSEVPARVRAVGTVVSAGEEDEQTGEEGEATIEVTVALDDPAAAGALVEAPVDVEVVTEAAAGVLAVPVQALLALAEGGYAVERAEGGATTLVPVELGAEADGLVEVTGDLSEGDQVVVPS